MELRHGFVVTQQSPEVKIHYVESNNRPHNPLIIFLHGFPEHWYSWGDYLHAVANEGYHGVALDLRGYNESSKPSEVEEYRLDKLVEDVCAVIQHFGNKSTFVVGHDWGGVIGIRALSREADGRCSHECPLPGSS
ncbi:MAG TPA: alpha/beta fold hydrolase [Bacteriovoracaceae bacterium]|nr:alpha/beta fold hydrolase [Bacteriovoracaceae bacterium]